MITNKPVIFFDFIGGDFVITYNRGDGEYLGTQAKIINVNPFIKDELDGAKFELILNKNNNRNNNL